MYTYITLHDVTLHYMTLHYITLHIHIRIYVCVICIYIYICVSYVYNCMELSSQIQIFKKNHSQIIRL